MIRRLLLLFAFTFPLAAGFTGLKAQGTLFDDSRVSSVFIGIPPDSLEVIMTDVLSDHYFMAMFVFDDGNVRDTLHDVGFRLRGNTSRFSKKKSFKISFNEYVPGRRYQGVKKINLNGQHNDPTMVREKLFYDLWKNSGLPERRTSFVRVYINQAYYGLYTNLEEFDKDWLDRVYGDNGGNLYKCTWPADLVYHGPDQQVYKDIPSGAATGGRAYDLQTNEAEDDYADLVELITLLADPPDSAFARAIAEKLDVDVVLKAFALDVATGNWDDYMYNKNNYFLYHHPGTDRFEFVSYDTDNTFGVDWFGIDWGSRNCLDWYAHTDPRPLAQKLLDVPQFNARYRQYLDTIARLVIDPGIVYPHIDSLKVLVTDAAIADSFRTLDYGYTVADFIYGFTQGVDEHTPYGIKSFLSVRSASVLQQLSASAVAEAGQENAPLSLYPVPAATSLTVTLTPSEYDRRGYVSDMLGRSCLSFVVKRNRAGTELSVSDLRPGVYLLVVEDAGRTLTSRFIKR